MRNTKGLLFFLVLFVAVSGAVDFFHVETDFATDYNCPACLFHSTFFAAARSLVLVITFAWTLLVVIRERGLPLLSRGRSLTVNNKSPPLS